MTLPEILEFTLIPLGALLVGGVLAEMRRPSARFDSAVQHFAGGVVFAAVGAELLPELKHSASPGAVALGFVLGVAAVLAVKLGSERLEGRDLDAALPVGMLLALGVDVLLDGALVGIGFVAGARQGILLTLALTLELLSLGLALGASLVSRGLPAGTRLALVGGMALLVPVGALLGAGGLAHASGGLFAGVLAFGTAALLYLVTEELLVEAHREDSTPWLCAFFFVGFLLVLLLEMLG